MVKLSRPEKLKDYVYCPECGNTLDFEEGFLKCDNCGTEHMLRILERSYSIETRKKIIKILRNDPEEVIIVKGDGKTELKKFPEKEPYDYYVIEEMDYKLRIPEMIDKDLKNYQKKSLSIWQKLNNCIKRLFRIKGRIKKK